MLHAIFGGKYHFVMSGHLCLTIYKMGDLWKVARHINKSETWYSSLRSRLLIPKFWLHIYLFKYCQNMTLKNKTCFVRPWLLADLKTVQLCSTLSKRPLGLDYWFSYLPLQLTIQKNFLERHLNVSFQFITIKIEVSNHDDDASEETVQILKTPLECPNVVRYLKMMAFCYQWWKCEWLNAFIFVHQPSIM